MVISTPEIFIFDIDKGYDFIFLGCNELNNVGDGVFDTLKNEDITDSIWSIFSKPELNTLHNLARKAVEQVIKLAMEKKTYDNVTGILIIFEDTAKYVQKKRFITKNSNKSIMNS